VLSPVFGGISDSDETVASILAGEEASANLRLVADLGAERTECRG
jgi:hypothetical protein